MDQISVNNQNELDGFNRRIEYFKCDFCPSTFCDEDNFNSHVLNHFEKKNCVNCDKLVLRIGSKWYQLHIDEIKIDGPENQFIDLYIKKEVDDSDNDIAEFNSESNIIETNSFKDDSDQNADQNTELDVFDEYQTEIDEKIKRKSKRKTSSNIYSENSDRNTSKAVEAHKPRGKRSICRIKCRICDRNIWNFNLESHLQKMHVPNIIVSKEKIKCETCGKFFANNGNLKIHQAIHSGIKRFVCSYCGKSYRQLFHLTEHMNGHTGEKPYNCDICHKRFGRYQILTAHLRIHTGVKPYKCNIEKCDRAFAYEIDLSRHKYSAHGIIKKKHICSVCAKVFPENKLLKKHLTSHSSGNIRQKAGSKA
ncbi:zinc finger protein 492-like [Contarinia nasturtii]|uniref:zinc finger protein 492-like n=1 Tax=Contarinia nasturtii TaxID=265458 RepID=UPI0012D3C48D|nr:zinc finger protein 492-like [Contarinia nasturtii]